MFQALQQLEKEKQQPEEKNKLTLIWDLIDRTWKWCIKNKHGFHNFYLLKT